MAISGDWSVWINELAKTRKVIAVDMQGLMWRATNADGTLTYAFIESIKSTYPYYAVRLAGGTMVFAGMLLMAWNVWKTIAGRTTTADSPVVQPA